MHKVHLTQVTTWKRRQIDGLTGVFFGNVRKAEDNEAEVKELDVSFLEDAARNRKDTGPSNIAVLRRRALDVVRRDRSKGSLSIKLRRAGWNDTFLRSILDRLAAP